MSNRKVYRECGEGWSSLIDPIIERIEETGGRVSQIKEKYGRLRIYWDPGEGEIDDSIERAVDEAEEKSATLCELCGAPARLMYARYWYQTLCPDHARELDYKEFA